MDILPLLPFLAMMMVCQLLGVDSTLYGIE
jgi:hypothetical protein